MHKFAESAGVAVIGTDARGGIRSVIDNHIRSGIYNGLKCYRLVSHEEGNVALKITLFIRAFFKLLQLLLCRKIDICHVHGSMKGSIIRKNAYIRLCNLFGVKVIFHLHGSEFEKTYEASGRIYRALVKSTLYRSNYIFVLSEYWEKYLREKFSGLSIFRANNYPSPEFEDIIERKQAVDNRIINFTFMGYVGQRKGIYDLLLAAAKLHSRCADKFIITIAGNGELEEVTKFIKDRNMSEYVFVKGWISGKEKYNVLKSTDILVLPSYNEGLPIAILEAMSAGIPVISTSVGGIPDAISDGDEGFLIEPGDVMALSDSMRKIINDNSLLNRLGMNSRARYDKKYSSKANVSRLQEAIAGMLPEPLIDAL